jgi:hypothetical protein
MGISFLWHMEEAGTAVGGRVNVALVTVVVRKLD